MTIGGRAFQLETPRYTLKFGDALVAEPDTLWSKIAVPVWDRGNIQARYNITNMPGTAITRLSRIDYPPPKWRFGLAIENNNGFGNSLSVASMAVDQFAEAWFDKPMNGANNIFDKRIKLKYSSEFAPYNTILNRMVFGVGDSLAFDPSNYENSGSVLWSAEFQLQCHYVYDTQFRKVTVPLGSTTLQYDDSRALDGSLYAAPMIRVFGPIANFTISMSGNGSLHFPGIVRAGDVWEMDARFGIPSMRWTDATGIQSYTRDVAPAALLPRNFHYGWFSMKPRTTISWSLSGANTDSNTKMEIYWNPTYHLG